MSGAQRSGVAEPPCSGATGQECLLTAARRGVSGSSCHLRHPSPRWPRLPQAARLPPLSCQALWLVLALILEVREVCVPCCAPWPGVHSCGPELTLSFTLQLVLHRSRSRSQSAPRRRGHRGPRAGGRRQVALRGDRRGHQSPGRQALCEGSDHILSGSQGGGGGGSGDPSSGS